jgi:ABC-type phosphate/phosphonate transport system substrate-binding protein
VGIIPVILLSLRMATAAINLKLSTSGFLYPATALQLLDGFQSTTATTTTATATTTATTTTATTIATATTTTATTIATATTGYWSEYHLEVSKHLIG